ncbi:MAG: hypothetical protein ACRD2E_10655 [Terriglobales bacterium]
MAKEERDFRLNADEAAFLGRLAQEDETIGGLLGRLRPPAGRGLTLRLSRARTEPIRDRLTELLATFGFAAGYSLTRSGQMIEALIDRLFWE